MYSSSRIRSVRAFTSFRGFTALTLLGVAALGLAAHPAAAQTTIRFDDSLPSQNPLNSPYSTQGFTFSTPSGFFANSETSSNGDRETMLITEYYGGITTLTQDNNQTFSFNAIDLNSFRGDPVSTLFTGTRTDGSTVTATKTTGGGTYQTFTFDGFTNLASLTFGPASGGNNSPLFGNVVVTSATPPVPEASTTVSLGLLLALGGLAFAVKRKKASTSA